MIYALKTGHLDIAFSSGALLLDGAPVSFEVTELGALEVVSGRVAASDPFVAPRPFPFVGTVPTGRHPVDVAIARFANDDERIAFARVRFAADRLVVRWEMALIEGQSLSALKTDEFFGYPVDAGIGCFMDAEAGALLDARMEENPDYFEVILDGMEASYRHTRSWFDFLPDDASSLNVICFSSGVGDGCYPSFFGLDANGAVCALVTDFLLIPSTA